MIQFDWKKILTGFAILFLLSRSGRIKEWLSTLDPGGILTLEPLRQSSPEARFLLTLSLLILAFVTIYSLLRK